MIDKKTNGGRFSLFLLHAYNTSIGRNVMVMIILAEIGAVLVGMFLSPWLEIVGLAVGFFLAMYYDWR